MSIASALNNATSGLTASARAVQVASANVANALTDGYAAREINLVSASLAGTGGGVRVASITRRVDPALLGLVRDSGASAHAGTRSNAFWQRVENAVGLPGSGLSAALSAFDTALISAAERPDLDSRLAAVADSAVALTGHLGRIEETVQQLRADADYAIAQDVRSLNEGLARIDTLNDQIVRLQSSDQSVVGLMDERQAVISHLSEIVPLREYPREHGRVMLYTASGQLLLDSKPVEFGFTRTPAVDASMSVGSGLSGLTLNGNPLSTAPSGPMGGGRLAANFAIRDTDAPSVQTQIDSFAADLIGRFADPATDPSLGGAPGVFTDAGGALTATPGLAGRIAVNTAILPDAGGELWRIRDGIGAAAPGNIGDSTQIGRLLGALDRQIASGPGAPLQTASATLGGLMSSLSRSRQSAEDTATTAQTRNQVLNETLLAQGVDTDEEMQHLLLIEQAYAANARVIQTADAMLRHLLEI
ncbi:flagellar hook-associated protein FlgK [Pararhodobacter zhoushanensis]|uniref:flagellar hook-associated protein FlgK n=1 Tax=Pararhodobacter zhoushanensis TaxID=2479545 RepID=UPI000F8D5A89|nr:flagellar hook-associated protein FlgK [Pararhodobacter zhoushanensis]